MEKDQILQTLKKILKEQFLIEEDKVTLESSYNADLNLDSLSVVDFLMEVQDQFDVKIPDAELNDVFTVGSTIDKIQELQSVN